MSIDETIINHLETLARIELTAAERKRLIVQLDRIVGYVAQLQQIDTDDARQTRATGPPFSDRPTLRGDEPGPCSDRDIILDEAPDTKRGLFRVPRIIER